MRRLALAGAAALALTLTAAPAALAQEPHLEQAADNSVCGEVTLTFTNNTGYTFGWDYVSDGGHDGTVNVPAGETKSKTLAFDEDSPATFVSYGTAYGPEQDWYLAHQAVGVDTDCQAEPTFPQKCEVTGGVDDGETGTRETKGADCVSNSPGYEADEVGAECDPATGGIGGGGGVVTETDAGIECLPPKQDKPEPKPQPEPQFPAPCEIEGGVDDGETGMRAAADAPCVSNSPGYEQDEQGGPCVLDSGEPGAGEGTVTGEGCVAPKPTDPPADDSEQGKQDDEQDTQADEGDTCQYHGVVHKTGDWKWDCHAEEWVPVGSKASTDDTSKGDDEREVVAVDTTSNDDSNLAATGVPVWWMLGGAGVLVAVGAGFVFAPRLIRKR